jgi:hypothetical protein
VLLLLKLTNKVVGVPNEKLAFATQGDPEPVIKTESQVVQVNVPVPVADPPDMV